MSLKYEPASEPLREVQGRALLQQGTTLSQAIWYYLFLWLFGAIWYYLSQASWGYLVLLCFQAIRTTSFSSYFGSPIFSEVSAPAADRAYHRLLSHK